jgi:tRNA nucleotidyltransferase (CCA-adding enzyme)
MPDSAGSQAEVVLDALARRPDGAAVRALRGVRAAVVGGFVRDTLIGRVPREIDLVVEGDTAEVAAALGGTLTSYESFLAARVSGDGWSIDITQARRERYPHPGALPIVEPARLEQDLARRDFTVNALAVTLESGELIDVEGALEDLAAQRLRVLHDESFIDDPTRVMRLARYAHRLGFTVDPHTASLAAAADLGTLTGSRIGAELRLALLEPDPLAPLADLTEKLPITVDRALVQAALALAPPDASRTLLILAAVTRERAPATWIESLELLARERDVILQAKRAPELAAVIEAATSPSELAAILRGVPVEVIAIAGALGPAAATRRWLTELRHIALEIDGDDLLAAGIVAGPELGARLERTLARKLDGQIDDGRQAELESALGERA